jgi:site-specific recombinase XerC
MTQYQLPVSAWPPTDAAAWHQACHPRPGPFSPHQPRSPHTYAKYAKGWGIYLRYLQTQGQLDRAAMPAQRITLERLGGFFAMLKARGNADYTIVGRFEELRGALRLMDPDADVSGIIRPQNVSIRQMLPMQRRQVFVPDARHVLLWAETLFRAALTLTDPKQRRLQVRDAALIGLLASRGPRLRTLSEMRLGRHLLRRGGAWELFFEKSVMKGGRQELELPNDPRVSAMLERYITVERLELLQGQTQDAVWVNRHGRPLTSGGISYMVRQRTKQPFGIGFGPHRLRHSLVTTAAVVDGTNALAPAMVLGHSPQTALKSYNRARNLEASRQHDARMNAAEAAAVKGLGGSAKRRGPARPARQRQREVDIVRNDRWS